LSSDNFYINSFTVLRNGVIAKDGDVVFQSAEKGLSFLTAAYEALEMDYPRFYKMDALSKTGIIAADLLLKDQPEQSLRPSDETGIVLSNRNGSIEADAQYWQASQDYPSPASFVYTLPNIVIGEISIRDGFKGENAFFVSDALDAAWIHWYVTDLMHRNLLKTCICGWVDVIGEASDACLFLVTSDTSAAGATFAIENLNRIYNKQYGK